MEGMTGVMMANAEMVHCIAQTTYLNPGRPCP